MKFVNLTEHTLRFDLRGHLTEVEPMGEIDVPQALVYVIKDCGVMLTPSSEVTPAPKPAPAPAPAKAEAEKPKADAKADEKTDAKPEPQKLGK